VNLDTLSKQAVQAALAKQWYKAVGLNEAILEQDPQNLEALNRLGRAYLSIGDERKARSYFRQALKHDPENPLAKKNLEALKNGEINPPNPSSPRTFVKEPGTTLTATFTSTETALGNPLQPGEGLNLNLKRGQVEIRSQKNRKVLGINQDMAERLFKLSKSGVAFEARFVGAKGTSLTVLVKASRPVFKQAIDYRPFVRSEDFEEEDLEALSETEEED